LIKKENLMRKSLLKVITILGLSSTILGAKSFIFEVTKQRDVLQNSNEWNVE